jgi:hypothetical protein
MAVEPATWHISIFGQASQNMIINGEMWQWIQLENFAMNPVNVLTEGGVLLGLSWKCRAEHRIGLCRVSCGVRGGQHVKQKTWFQTFEHVKDGTEETGSNNNLETMAFKTASSSNYNTYKLDGLWIRDSVVSTAMRLRARRSGLRIPKRKEIFLLIKRPDQFWGSPSLVFSNYRSLLPGLKRPEAWCWPLTLSAKVKSGARG